MRRTLLLWLLAFLLMAGGLRSWAAEVVLPQNRTAYFVAEPVELAVAGLAKGAQAEVALVPQGKAAELKFRVQGDGGTVAVRIPPYTLAPATYQVAVDGQATNASILVARGVRNSTMFTSQTISPAQLAATGGNFAVSNAFSYGILNQGLPSDQPRQRGPGMQIEDRHIGMDVPSLVYMYWTGYVLHKPWGDLKSWAADHMTENMRLFNFHVAQRLRRFQPNLLSVGTLDEPGLAWGKTPAGGMASGFPNWDEQAWYESRGWPFTLDPASRDDADWMRYMTVRCDILGAQNAQARRDLQTVCPDLVFSTDLYAPHAIMDGTDPWNQRCNQIPSSHVFLDWGTGKLGVIGGVYLEKAHDPTAKLAHAMNGQLFGKRVPQPQTRYAYHLMINGMMAAGLASNWWLNYGGMEPADLLAVNEPPQRLGPVLVAMSPSDHDVALLWSFTEIAMRCKDITAREASKKQGEPIKLLVADLPENFVLEEGELDINAYSIGGNYKQQVLNMHQALNRAGYPAHILHERLLPGGILSKYKTLVIVGQTFELPQEVRRAIEAFVAGGGKVVVDATSTVEFPSAIVVDANLKDAGHRWTVPYLTKAEQFKSPREASYFQTNHFMDSFARAATPAVREAMAKTGSKPVLVTDSAWLGCERHVGGEGELHLVLNAHEQLPDVPESESYYIYNYAPLQTEIALPRVGPDRVVFEIAGLDWRRVTRVENAAAGRAVSFEPGEMKMYLVAPRMPAGLQLSASADSGRIALRAALQGLKMPWPLTMSLVGPDGQNVLEVYRSTDNQGVYEEVLPVGRNVPAGKYRVVLHSPVGPLQAAAEVDLKTESPSPEPIAPPARVFDQNTIQQFFAAKPPVTIALAADEYRPLAEKLAAALNAKGIPAKIAAEASVWRKALYPRVWDPYLTVYQPGGDDQLNNRAVKLKATIETVGYNHHRVRDADGNEIADWRQPQSLLTVTGNGVFIEEGGRHTAYEAGVVLYVAEQNRMEVVRGTPHEVRTTHEVQARWARPWHTIQQHVGGHHLVPQLPEAYQSDMHLILIGNSRTSELVRALQASELLLQVADEKYPGPGKSLVSFAWSPFALEKHVVLVAGTDLPGLTAGTDRLIELLGP